MDRKARLSMVLLAFLSMAVLASVIGVAPLTALAASTPPAVEWSRTYSEVNVAEVAFSVQQTSDGGYILAGVTYTKPSDHWDFWLAKTNSNGSIEWNRKYGENDLDEIAYSVRQTRDGGYIIAGWVLSASGSDHCLLVKTSSTGSVEWRQTYRGVGASCVLQTTDGGYAFVGSAISGDFLLVKTSSSGGMQWSQTYGGADSEQAFSFEQTTDGGYIIGGRAMQNNPPYASDFWLVKANSTGAMEWNRRYGGTGSEDMRGVRQTSDGGYILAGSTTSFGAGYATVWLVKTNSTGLTDWSHTYYVGENDIAFSVQQTIDGGYIVAGKTNLDGFLLRTGSTGGLKWLKIYGGDSYDEAQCVQQTSDYGYIVAGTTASTGAGLMKLEADYKDTDGDGLLDDWEKNGIDSNDDDIVDLYLPGADWQHKDLFVEVDYMGVHHRPDQAPMDDVVAAFANAPVTNPDGLPGIKLHIDVDDQIPHQDVIRAFTDFDNIKSSYFGTAAQQSSPNSPYILDAKALAYRYCLFAHQYSTYEKGTWEATNSSGIAERPGNDFIVSLGAFKYGWGSREEQAGTFMHELGHNLGLDHGGGDDINYKPNYLSIMSYSFQMPWYNPWRSLDYSRRKLPTLYEGSLDEPLGIQAGTQELNSWGYTVWNNSKKGYAYGIVDAKLDWNGDGNLSYLVRANINNFTGWGYNSDANEILVGYDDWANVKLAFGNAENFADGVHVGVVSNEITSEIVQAMLESVLAMHEVAVFNVTSSSTVWGQGGALSVNVTLGNLGGSDENVNVTVYANSTLVASGSLVVKAGNLSTVTLPYNGQTLAAGNYTLTAAVSPVAQESYTADNTATGGVVTVTGVIPEFSPAAMLAALLVASSAVLLTFRRKRTS